MDLKVLFWNINGKTRKGNKKLAESLKVIEAVKSLDQQHNFDVILLAECKNQEVRDMIASELQMKQVLHTTEILKSTASKIVAFHRLSPEVFDPRNASFKQRQHYMKIAIGDKVFLLAGVHLVDQFNTNSRLVVEAANKARHEIFQYVKESDSNIDGIVVVGDFNMDPFDAGMTIKDSMYTTMDINLCKEEEILGHRIERFFNPSWHLHGNRFARALGTFRMTSRATNNISFHMLDQVIYTKSLEDHFEFRYEDFEIITEYLYNGDTVSTAIMNHLKQPLKNIYSDHLPIRFFFKYKKEESS